MKRWSGSGDYPYKIGSGPGDYPYKTESGSGDYPHKIGSGDYPTKSDPEITLAKSDTDQGPNIIHAYLLKVIWESQYI